MTLGGEIGSPQDWGPQFWNDEFTEYTSRLLFAADALLLGRLTYQGLSSAYPTMSPSPDGQGASREFIERMNTLPKYVASRTLHEVGWNASLLGPDLASEVAALKALPGQDILKYGTGTLDRVLMAQDLIDEFHLWLMPVALGSGQRIFEDVEDAPRLKLVKNTQFSTGVVVLTYVPER